MRQYRLERSQDDHWRISEFQSRWFEGAVDEWWDVIVGPSHESAWIKAEYDNLVESEALTQKRNAAESRRVWDIVRSNEQNT